jgi:2-oxo-4-hydroxy-4-carboxy--5-ureidoimidazoline (OHCU) decarboxylase
MIDFDRKPKPRSADEKELEALRGKYAETFGVPYVFAVGLNENTMQETLADMRRRIAEHDPQPAPEYKKGVDY